MKRNLLYAAVALSLAHTTITMSSVSWSNFHTPKHPDEHKHRKDIDRHGMPRKRKKGSTH